MGTQRKPDIILMDVQMPTMDGYRCTHILRKHEPYGLFVRDVPIVAMTASAIQGDKEKCKRAGMDDYLSKPVRGAVLEKMLVQWSISRRVNETSPGLSETEILECSDVSSPCQNTQIQPVIHGGYAAIGEAGTTSIAQIDDFGELPGLPTPITQTHAKDNSGEGEHFPLLSRPKPDMMQTNSVLPDSIQPARLCMQTDEMSRQSRDDKLVGAAGARGASSPLAHNMHDPFLAHQALTEENMGKARDAESLKRRSR